MLTAALISVFYLAWKVVGLPFVPFDAFRLDVSHPKVGRRFIAGTILEILSRPGGTIETTFWPCTGDVFERRSRGALETQLRC
jgi:hypothetical protein